MGNQSGNQAKSQATSPAKNQTSSQTTNQSATAANNFSGQFANAQSDVRAKGEQIVENLSLSGYSISIKSSGDSLIFKKGFKEATIPLALVERNQWADIRQIFRAVFQAGPQVENFSAQNEWSRWTVK